MKQVSMVLILVIVSCNFNQSEKLLAEANGLDTLGKLSEAIRIYDQVLESDTANVSALLARAFDKGQLGDQEGEIEDLNKLLKITPANTLALFNLGVVYGNLGKYAESIGAFNNAVATKGGELVSLNFVKNDFVDNAQYRFDIPIADIKLERGIVYYKADSLRKAYFDLTYCIDNGHDLKDSYYYRSRTYLKSAMLEHACRDAKMSALHGMKEANEIVVKYCR